MSSLLTRGGAQHHRNEMHPSIDGSQRDPKLVDSTCKTSRVGQDQDATNNHPVNRCLVFTI
jgi:hypothetical protein